MSYRYLNNLYNYFIISNKHYIAKKLKKMNMSLIELVKAYKQEPEIFMSEDPDVYKPWRLPTMINYLTIESEGYSPIDRCQSEEQKLDIQMRLLDILEPTNPGEDPKIKQYSSESVEAILKVGDNMARYICLNRCPERTRCAQARNLGWVNTDIIYPAGFKLGDIKVYLEPVNNSKLVEIHRVH